MLVLGIFILLSSFYRCISSETLYNEATIVCDEKNDDYAELYKTYHLKNDSFDADINTSLDPTTPFQTKGDYILAFQELVVEKGYCRKDSCQSMQTFRQCMEMYGRQIPDECKCPPLNGPCDPYAKYRSYDGYCNNLKNPNNGKFRMAYINLLGRHYSDGIWKLRKSECGEDLPSPRLIGNLMTEPCQYESYPAKLPVYNFWGLELGQLLAHDVSNKQIFTIKGTSGPANPLTCCTADHSAPLDKKDINPHCIPVSVPSDDPTYGCIGVRCMSVVRLASAVDNNCKIQYSQLNDQSAWVDLSPIYPNNKTTADSLRVNSGGKLIMDSKNILPLRPNGRYFTGDARSGQTPILNLLHSVFFRKHNYLCEGLSRVNPHWCDEKLFQEARRINIAIYQHLVYNEWLPIYLDKGYCEKYKLLYDGKCSEYDCDIDGSIAVEFSVSGFRFCHKFVPAHIQLMNCAREIINKVPLSDTFGKDDLLRDNYDDMLFGTLCQGIDVEQFGYTPEVRDRFFKVPFKGKLLGGDLFLIDITRVRDGGTAPFVEYFPYCLNTCITCWDDLIPHIDPNHLKFLKQAYNKVGDIDLLVGLLCEKHGKGKFGPIGSCLTAEQFKRLKYGDRFFYTNSQNPYKFTPEQLCEITSMSFSKFICFVSGLKEVPRNGLVKPECDDDFVSCKSFIPFNFELFRERPVSKCVSKISNGESGKSKCKSDKSKRKSDKSKGKSDKSKRKSDKSKGKSDKSKRKSDKSKCKVETPKCRSETPECETPKCETPKCETPECPVSTPKKCQNTKNGGILGDIVDIVDVIL